MNGSGTPREGPSPDRCSQAQQQGSGRHPATARVKLSKEVNKILMNVFTEVSCLMKKENLLGDTKKEMFRKWREKGMFESTEQCVCDQARTIRKNSWLSELELEAIQRQEEDEYHGELFREDVTVEVETIETDTGTVEEEMNDAEDSIGDTEGDLSKEYRTIVEKVNEIIVEGRTGKVIMFKKVDKKVLKVQTDRLNEAIKYLKSKSITEINNLNRAATVWMAEQIGLKKAEHRERNEPRWKRKTEGDIKRLR